MANRSKVLEQVAKLVALSESPNGNEARNSALKACQLIIKHKLTVCFRPPTKRMPVEGQQAGEPVTGNQQNNSSQARTGFEWFDGVYDEFFKTASKKPVGRSDIEIFTASIGGVCFHCQRYYAAGEKIAVSWHTGHPHSFHSKCSEAAVAAERAQ